MLIYILLTEALRDERAKERQRERERGGRVCRSSRIVGRTGWSWGWPTACLLWLLRGFILFAF